MILMGIFIALSADGSKQQSSYGGGHQRSLGRFSRLAHAEKASRRCKEVATFGTQRAKLVGPCSEVVWLDGSAVEEEVTNEIEETMAVGALLQARVGDRKRAE